MTATRTDVPYLDTLAPDFRPNGPEVAEARARSWYARTPIGIMVLRHEALSRLLIDRRLRQGSHRILAAQGLTEGPMVEWMNSIILSIEGADHARQRRLVSMAFTPRAVTALRPRIREIADELIDQFPPGQVEFMSAFADPYPARVICELLGVPARLRDRVHGWANDIGLMFGDTAAANQARIETALAGLFAAVDVLIAERRAEPGTDLLSGLIAARDGRDEPLSDACGANQNSRSAPTVQASERAGNGGALTDDELGLLVSGLLFAGQDTTHHQLGHAMNLFLNHPDQWRLLTERPELAASAVQEVVRLAPSTPMTGRLAVTDFEFDGVPIPAGTLLQMCLWGGNTDPDVFGPDAERFDIAAERPAPLTFGAGPHYCLGAALARAEMEEALPILARRLGPIRPGGPADWRPPQGITGPTRLPIAFGVA